jgi:hypothetical protein
LAAPGETDAVRTGGYDVVLFAGGDTPAAAVSGELARYRGAVFTAARTIVRADGDWNLELFNGPVPRGFSNTVIDPGDMGRRQWGGAIHRVKRYRHVYSRASFYTNGQRGESKLKRRRRIEFTGRGGVWDISYRFTEERTVTHSTKVIGYDPRLSYRRQSRYRVTLGGANKKGFHQLYRLIILTGGGSGVLGSIGLGYGTDVFDAKFQISNYALAPGQIGYVTRPGIAGYETVAVVTGTGSDLSSRIRVRTPGGGTLSLYWGQPWDKNSRLYASVKIAL